MSKGRVVGVGGTGVKVAVTRLGGVGVRVPMVNAAMVGNTRGIGRGCVFWRGRGCDEHGARVLR